MSFKVGELIRPKSSIWSVTMYDTPEWFRADEMIVINKQDIIMMIGTIVLNDGSLNLCVLCQNKLWWAFASLMERVT